MTEISKNEAFEFASAMAETYPPTNTNLIQKHRDWWESSKYDASDITTWYDEWVKTLNSDDPVDPEVYSQFTDKLDELGIDY